MSASEINVLILLSFVTLCMLLVPAAFYLHHIFFNKETQMEEVSKSDQPILPGLVLLGLIWIFVWWLITYVIKIPGAGIAAWCTVIGISVGNFFSRGKRANA